ncbi:MAG: MBL fold metallo-hydrolase [Streptomycetaceae bacterium]|nr:MBL fold metallo-hydrolase [Streptomycetaceae bacterium]
MKLVDTLPLPEYTPGLHQVADGTYAYLGRLGWGWSNAGLVVGAGQSLLVDTLFTLGLTRDLLHAVRQAAPAAPVSTVVTTHANPDHTWGNQLLDEAEIISSRQTAEDSSHEVPPEVVRALLTGPVADGLETEYLHRHFGVFDFSGITPVGPTRTFDGRLELDVGGRAVELLEVGPAHTPGDVIVHVPDARVVYTGDVLFIGDFPVCWTSPLSSWVGACDQLLATGAQRFVPGHGPVTTVAGVREFRGFLQEVGTYAVRRAKEGTPLLTAAAEAPVEHYAWGCAERVVTAIASGYQEVGAPVEDGESQLGMMGLIARFDAVRRG